MIDFFWLDKNVKIFDFVLLSLKKKKKKKNATQVFIAIKNKMKEILSLELCIFSVSSTH